jgi:curli biogenesis system outer membrane secretion channel CsgG
MKRAFIHILALISLCCAAQAQTSPESKKRVAVFAFDTSTIYGAGIHVNGQSLGGQIADILLSKLVQTGKYSVIERKFLEKVLAEQDFKYSERFDQNSIARIGRLLGVEGIIVGEVTHAATDVQCTDTAIWKLGVKGCTETSEISVSARLVSTETAEILAATDGEGRAKRSRSSGTSVGGKYETSSGGQTMSSKTFSDAVHKAVQKLATPLADSEPKLARVSAQPVKVSEVKSTSQPPVNKPSTELPAEAKAPLPPARSTKADGSDVKVAAPQVAAQYTIEVGAYSNQVDARVRAGSLMSAGMDARIVPLQVSQNRTLYEVQTGSFPNKDAAQKYGAQLKVKGVAVKYSVVPAQ